MSITIGGNSFRDPNEWGEQELNWTSIWRAYNGVLSVQKRSYDKKREHVWTFEYLTETEFNNLISYQDDIVTVVSTTTGHILNKSCYIVVEDSYSHALSGGRKDVKLRLLEV
jgi:hypothetical protein